MTSISNFFSLDIPFTMGNSRIILIPMKILCFSFPIEKKEVFFFGEEGSF